MYHCCSPELPHSIYQDLSSCVEVQGLRHGPAHIAQRNPWPYESLTLGDREAERVCSLRIGLRDRGRKREVRNRGREAQRVYVNALS